MASEKRPVRYTKDGKVDMRGRHAKPPQHRGNIDPELTKQIGAELMYWYVKPKAVTDDEIAERLTEYFQRTLGQGKLPTVEGMCLALGYPRETIWRWENGAEGSTPFRRTVIKKAKDIIATYDANLVAEGKLNPVTYIFRSKNYYGMKDQQEHVITPNNPLGDATSPEEIKKRLDEGIPEDIIDIED